MEMGYNEISIMILDIGRNYCSMIPENPPIVNSATKAIENNIGVSNDIEPLNIVATQLNTLTPVGIAISIVEYIKNNSPAKGIPTVNI